MSRRLVVGTGLAALAVAVAACGLPADGRFEPIGAGDDRFGLGQTTLPTTTLAPTTTLDVTTTTLGITTTVLATTSTIATEVVNLYFITGRQLTSVTAALPANPALGQVMAALLDGPPAGELGTGLRTTLSPGADIAVTSSAGIATVDLPEGIFDSLEPNDQRLVFGQIVLTLTGRPGVGPVVFTLDGEPIRVFRGDASLTEPGEAVSRDDYVSLLSGGPVASTTSTSTTTTSTSTTSTTPGSTDPGAEPGATSSAPSSTAAG